MDSPLNHESSSTATLDEVDIRHELASRPSRSPNYQAESEALVELARELAHRPQNILQKLVDIALGLCRAQTAGISLLEKQDGQSVFRWEALAGVYAHYRHSTMPREASPCGTTIDRNGSQLMSWPARCFPALVARPPVAEALLIPFHNNDGRPVGTVWLVTHDGARKFDAEDERLAKSLSFFAAAAWQLWKAESAAKDSARREHERAFEVSQVNVTLRQELTARQQMEESLRDTLGKLERSRAEFHGKMTELQRFQEAIFEREHRLTELEKENQQLRDQLKRQEQRGAEHPLDNPRPM